MDKKIMSATVVATPTTTSWSQAYIAGNFFAVISLTYKDAVEVSADNNLAALGKEIINTVEAEYFTLETKNLSSIKQAIDIAIKQTLEKESLMLSAGFASLVDNVLYVFSLGGAKAYMKRGENLGLLLSSDQTDTLVSASGFVENNDTVILQTAQFGNVIPVETIKNAATHITPGEIAENLSPILHEQQNGGASAVIFSYKEKATEAVAASVAKEEEVDKEIEQENIKPAFFHTLFAHIGKVAHWINHVPTLFFASHALNRRKKMFLTLAVVLAITLIGSVFFVLQKTQAAKNEALFEKVYTQAQEKYDQGQSLSTLNKNLARDNFAEAKKTLLQNKNAFENDKPHLEKINVLLKNVEDALAVVSGVNKVDAQAIAPDQDLFLATIAKHNPLATSQDEKNIYGINQTVIFRIDKKTQKKIDIVTNKNSWQNPGGIGTFLNNIYVLDKSAGQIYKFVPSGNTYSKANYLVGDTQDFSQTQSIAIDGSIWVLSVDGAIQKWTRGKTDSFTVSGIDQPLNKPTRIFTDADIDNVYILDNGNARIVVLKKTGEYLTQYQNNILKTAREFDVLEKDKKIFVLSSGKIWQINL